MAGFPVITEVRHLGAEDQEQLTIEAISSEAITTSEIEGEILDRASVQSSIRRQFGLVMDHRRVKPDKQGIAEMVVSLYRNFSDPLSDDMLFAWHRMLTNGLRDLTNIGSYRTGMEPRARCFGTLGAPNLHF